MDVLTITTAGISAVFSAGLAGLLGAVAASFGCLVAARLPAGLSLAQPSHCDSCQRRLGPLELAPIARWLALRGRCRGCRAAVPARYVLAEAACAAVWAVLAVLLPGGGVLAAALLITWIVLVVLCARLEHAPGARVRSQPPSQVLAAVLPAAGVVSLLQSLLAQLHAQQWPALTWALLGMTALLLGALLSTRTPRPTPPSASWSSHR